MNDNPVNPSKQAALAARMMRLGIRAADLVEQFVRGSGHGGQKLNKTSSCVYLRHNSTGLEVKCQQTRSRELNRFLARRLLCDRIEERLLGIQSARRQAIEKIRRQKRRRSRRAREHLLADKHHQTDKKSLRRPVRDFE